VTAAVLFGAAFTVALVGAFVSTVVRVALCRRYGHSWRQGKAGWTCRRCHRAFFLDEP
jgi:hypothetical protein